MNRQRMMVILRKDLKEVVGNSQIIYPMLLVPLVFVGVMPTILVLSARFGGQSDQFTRFTENLPVGLLPQLAGLTALQKVIYFMTVYMMSGLFLLIPIMVSMMISANSFAGEKERRTLEGLLYTPITDKELVLGKIMAAFVPAMIVSWICFALYAVLVNALAWPVFGSAFFPTLNWWVMMLWLVPAAAFLAIGLVVLVSAKVRGYQEANSMAGGVVLPIVAITIGQSTGVMYFSSAIVFATGLVFAIIDFVLLRFITGVFHRDKLIPYLK